MVSQVVVTLMKNPDIIVTIVIPAFHARQTPRSD